MEKWIKILWRKLCIGLVSKMGMNFVRFGEMMSIEIIIALEYFE